jgi:hypothetical protein
MMIDNMIIERMRNVDVVAFLEKYNGFTFAHRGGAFRCEQHPSLAVKNDRLSWYWHSQGIGGHGALDYLVKAENMAFRDAVGVITGATPPTAPARVNLTRSAEPPKALVLPEKAGIPLKLYDYLCKKRGIDGDIVNTLLQEEKLYEDRRGNVVFVGNDEQGTARFASLRGTYGDFRGDCPGSDKLYGINMASPDSDQLYVFESPIDAMSHGSMDNAFRGNKDAWKRINRLSLAGTSDTALPFFLNQHKEVKEIVLCLDNDPAGREAAIFLMRKYAEKGYFARIEPPMGKDFNEDLTAFLTQEKAQKRTKSSHRDVDI